MSEEASVPGGSKGDKELTCSLRPSTSAYLNLASASSFSFFSRSFSCSAAKSHSQCERGHCSKRCLHAHAASSQQRGMSCIIS